MDTTRIEASRGTKIELSRVIEATTCATERSGETIVMMILLIGEIFAINGGFSAQERKVRFGAVISGGVQVEVGDLSHVFIGSSFR